MLIVDQPVPTDATIVQKPREINTKTRRDIAGGRAVPNHVLIDLTKTVMLNIGREIDLGIEGAIEKMTQNHQEMRKIL